MATQKDTPTKPEQREMTVTSLNEFAFSDPEAMKDFVEGMQEDISEGVGPGEMSKISIPAGGSTNWEYEDFEGDQSTPELVGVIVENQRQLAYWQHDDPDGTPPDCSSVDAITGRANPESELNLWDKTEGQNSCATCQFAQFGSKPGKRGKACREQHNIFLLCDDSMLPIMVGVSPASLRAFKDYRVSLLNRSLRLHKVVSSLTLKKAKNKDGQVYSTLVIKTVALLDGDGVKAIEGYRQAMKINTSRDVAVQQVTGDTDRPTPSEPVSDEQW